MSTEIITAIITASVTISGIILTVVYSVLHDRTENKRLAVELYNQREIKIFEARLESYREIFSALMPLEKRAVSTLTPERAIEIEQQLKTVFYVKQKPLYEHGVYRKLDHSQRFSYLVFTRLFGSRET